MKTRRTQASIHKPNIRIVRNIIIFLLIIVATAIVLVNKKTKNRGTSTVEDYLKDDKDCVNNDKLSDNSKNKASPQGKNNIIQNNSNVLANKTKKLDIHTPEESKFPETNKPQENYRWPKNSLLTGIIQKDNILSNTFVDKNKQLKIVKSDSSKNSDKPTRSIRKYIVKQGDTLGKISKKYYGTIIYYKKIAEFNKNRLKNSRYLTIGQELLIPVIEKVKTKTSKKHSNKIQKRIEKAYLVKNKEIKRKKLYTIKADDTLSKISKKFYNNSKYWHIIQEVNSKIKNLNRLHIGNKIVIPSFAEAKKEYNRLYPGNVKRKGISRERVSDNCRFHKVQKGENLHIIAKKFNIQLVELIEANEKILKGDFDKIIEGTQLKIPSVVSSD